MRRKIYFNTTTISAPTRTALIWIKYITLIYNMTWWYLSASSCSPTMLAMMLRLTFATNLPYPETSSCSRTKMAEYFVNKFQETFVKIAFLCQIETPNWQGSPAICLDFDCSVYWKTSPRLPFTVKLIENLRQKGISLSNWDTILTGRRLFALGAPPQKQNAKWQASTRQTRHVPNVANDISAPVSAFAVPDPAVYFPESTAQHSTAQ